LRHRLVTNFNADAEGFDADKIIARLLEIVPAKDSTIASNPATAKAVGAVDETTVIVDSETIDD
jgi:hypothetical protein